jgi:hypothetical protein
MTFSGPLKGIGDRKFAAGFFYLCPRPRILEGRVVAPGAMQVQGATGPMLSLFCLFYTRKNGRLSESLYGPVSAQQSD